MNTPEQILAVLAACRSKPKWPSQVTVPGMNDFDATHQAEKLKLFEKLHVEGFLTRVPGATGVRTGKGFGITEKGQAEIRLLSRHPGHSKREKMTSQTLTPQIGRIILGQLEEPKRESAIVLDGFKSWDAWDRQRLTFFLEALAARGFAARETPPEGIRTPGAWKATEKGREAMTRGDFLAEA